jgi:hypothetical protein
MRWPFHIDKHIHVGISCKCTLFICCKQIVAFISRLIALSLYINLCLIVKLDSLSCSFTSISSLTKYQSKLRISSSYLITTVYSVCRSYQFYWWRKPEYPEKTTDMPQVTNKLYHIIEYISPWALVELITFGVIGTDCIGSCKSNYHTITPTMVIWLCFFGGFLCFLLDIFKIYT